MKKKNVTIIDYGASNLASLVNALNALGIAAEVTGDPRRIQQAEKLILPGVGAFGPAMKALNQQKIAPIIQERAQKGTPLLGICLGMQLLFSRGLEDGAYDGLDLIPGAVSPLTQAPKLPHMGWNTLTLTRDILWEGVAPHPHVYFVHSFVCRPDKPNAAIARTEYGETFVSAVRWNNVWGLQFHPEKSQKAGLKMLKNFITQTGGPYANHPGA